MSEGLNEDIRGNPEFWERAPSHLNFTKLTHLA